MFLYLTSIMPEKETLQLRQIYEKYARFMYYVSLKYLDDAHLAQDCTHESLIRLIKYLNRLENMNFRQTKSYIYQVVASTALNMKKVEQRYIPEYDEKRIYMVDNVFQEDEVERAFFRSGKQGGVSTGGTKSQCGGKDSNSAAVRTGTRLCGDRRVFQHIGTGVQKAHAACESTSGGAALTRCRD